MHLVASYVRLACYDTVQVAIELVKVVKNSPVEHYKNAFLNLALPLFVFSEPAAAVKMKMRWYKIYYCCY